MRFAILILGLATGGLAAADFGDARTALEDGFPDVAVQKLEAKLEDTNGSEEGRLLLAEAYLRADRPLDALKVLEKASSPESEALGARASEALGDYAGAAKRFRKILEVNDSRWNGDAQRGLSRVLRKQGHLDAALQALLPLPAGNADESALAAASLALDLGRLNDARDFLNHAGSAGSQPQKLLLEAAILERDGDVAVAREKYAAAAETGGHVSVLAKLSLARISPPAEAKSILEKLIDQKPKNGELTEAFEQLWEAYQSGENPSPALLKKWASEGGTKGAGAVLLQARIDMGLNRPALAAEALEAILTRGLASPLQQDAVLLLAQARLQMDQAPSAIRALRGVTFDSPERRASMLFLLAQAQLDQNYNHAAALGFDAAARTDPEIAEEALFNAQIARLRARTPIADPGTMPSAPDLLSTLEYARVLRKARQRDALAGIELGNLLGETTGTRSEQARLARAEVLLMRGSFDEARTELQRVRNETLSPDTAQQADFAAIFAAEQASAEEEVGRAYEFLQRYPDSPRRDEVRMKLGEALARRGDYSKALQQFRLAAEDSNNDKLRQSAFFLAGECASRGMTTESLADALALYERAAKLGGDLGSRARLGQAQVKSAMAQPQEAVAILDQILSNPAPADLAAVAGIEKGDTLFLMASAQPSLYRDAGKVYTAVAATAPEPWKSESLTKLGITLQKLGETAAALAAWYDVYREPKPEALSWFYRAGFEAGSVYEKQSKWKEAIAVYEKIGNAPGPRSQEATDRADRLRLENFVWEKDNS